MQVTFRNGSVRWFLPFVALLAAFLALVQPTAAGARTEGQLKVGTPSRSGVITVSATATIGAGACENPNAGVPREPIPAEPEGGPPEPCGGRLALIVSPPQVERRGWRLRPRPTGCPSNFQTGELRNTQKPQDWLRTVRLVGIDASNPPWRVAWRGSLLGLPGDQLKIDARLHLRYGLWGGGGLETPCLSLVYLFTAWGSESADACLPGVQESIREEVCDQEYWRERWLLPLAGRRLGTAFPSCREAERNYRSAMKRWRKFQSAGSNGGRQKSRQRQAAVRRATKQISRSCPPRQQH